MEDDRLGDLAVLAAERDIHTNFEEVVNLFAKIHNNSRIPLC
jgi:hypothetical protein